LCSKNCEKPRKRSGECRAFASADWLILLPAYLVHFGRDRVRQL
jgi:hypothetical protein